MDHTLKTRVSDSKVNIDTKISSALGNINKLKANQIEEAQLSLVMGFKRFSVGLCKRIVLYCQIE